MDRVMVMKKHHVLLCLAAVVLLVTLPIGEATSTVQNQSMLQKSSQQSDESEQVFFDSPLFTGYILIHVYTYSPGVGIAPCVGANVTARGFLYSYQGQTDDSGDCLLQVHTNLFRAKRYVVKVSVEPGDWLHTRRITVLLQPRQILYKEFLFIAL
jgi:hypothetical protein